MLARRICMYQVENGFFDTTAMLRCLRAVNDADETRLLVPWNMLLTKSVL